MAAGSSRDSWENPDNPWINPSSEETGKMIGCISSMPTVFGLCLLPNPTGIACLLLGCTGLGCACAMHYGKCDPVIGERQTPQTGFVPFSHYWVQTVSPPTTVIAVQYSSNERVQLTPAQTSQS